MKENFGFAKKVALLHNYNFLHCFGQLFEDGLGVLAGIREPKSIVGVLLEKLAWN